jgi:ElaB/YqjD/DUF883 family membrane-anchored ribosome-binding protein
MKVGQMTTTGASTGKTDKFSADPSSDKEEIMEHVRALREDFAALASSTGKLAAGQFKKQSQKAGDLAETAVEKAGTYRDLLVEKVKDHPLASIGIAALAGLIVATMNRR